MKKILLAAAVCMAGLSSVKAQIAKGNLFVGSDIGTATFNSGTLTYDYSTGNIQKTDHKKFEIGVSPALGVFVTDHLVIGGNLNVNYSHIKDNITLTDASGTGTVATSNSSTYAIGPFLRYYFFNTTPSKTLLYIQGVALVGSGSGSTNESHVSPGDSYVSTSNDNNMFIFRANGSLGITHFIGKSVALDVALGYLYNYEKYTTNYNIQPTNGAVNSGSVKTTVPENGVALSAGFHFFLP
ncbi:hypothetical protein [Mucilaginibacter gotjawali]|uniref:Uncharacterized protein n=2 Tax=Mucilaginibacter gotjawali TaxID=1550579 RepID=A0A110B127_9SPHI|nr:hypothetical protein [Mucilaginibacter gotjawali]MBB3056564.1 hypothetical protein [Mucilaginibacter gotjawali]BAU52732.1 hypothetical protein MgSA37_00895 [Mucilaginibacter gotjawali]